MTPNKSPRARGCAGLLLLLLFLSACGPTFRTADGNTPQFSGTGPAEHPITWDGPAVLHIQARQGSRPLQVTLYSGLERWLLVDRAGPVDEYRGHLFTGDASTLAVQGDADWVVTLLPPSAEYFPVLRVPGEYKGRGSAVILLEGEYGVARFDIDRARRLEAWAYGSGGSEQAVAEKVYFDPDGDYKGIAVLPEGVSWLVVSAEGPWSVKVEEPCCERKY